ncbi:hypothetical protein SAMN05421803_11769 [Nocardiopsis flavescens]|uniref:Uncharacterized protein n=1 Tax=Nocardiopsis flavescens TaxID=758803 RepID=A0A1M6RE95_9ACTN|nr:hypothetical protein [Nocardiopsis flavescens]SHK30726.1 hypothetical protein SAMN05421803_11769 [Nocardiopsis flavescens]
MNLLVTLLLTAGGLAVVFVFLHRMTGGLVPDRASDLAELRAIRARQGGGEVR